MAVAAVHVFADVLNIRKTSTKDLALPADRVFGVGYHVPYRFLHRLSIAALGWTLPNSGLP